MPEIAGYSKHDSEINLPAFPRICPSGLNGPYQGASGGSDVGVVRCADGACLNYLTGYTFMPVVTVTLTHQLHRASLL